MKKFEDVKMGLNAPQFPGQQVKGLTIDQIRTQVKKQNRIKGYNFSVTTGTTNFNIQLSGTARILLGLVLMNRSLVPANGFVSIATISLKVNNEIVIENVDPNFLTQFLMNDEYYYLPRPLSGTDEITITFTNPGATENCNIAFYYI